MWVEWKGGFFVNFWFRAPTTREVGRRASLGQEYVQPGELGPLGLWMLGYPWVVQVPLLKLPGL